MANPDSRRPDSNQLIRLGVPPRGGLGVTDFAGILRPLETQNLRHGFSSVPVQTRIWDNDLGPSLLSDDHVFSCVRAGHVLAFKWHVSSQNL